MSFIQAWLDSLSRRVGDRGYQDTGYSETQPSEHISVPPVMSVIVVEHEIREENLRADLGVPHGEGMYLLSHKEVDSLLERDKQILRGRVRSHEKASFRPQEPFTFIDEEFAQRDHPGSVCYFWKTIERGRKLLERELCVLHTCIISSDNKTGKNFYFRVTTHPVQGKSRPLILQKKTRVILWTSCEV